MVIADMDMLTDEERSLIDEICKDCERWSGFPKSPLHDYDDYMTLHGNNRSPEIGYQLCLNGHELWWGTLAEINAVVKSMIRRIENADDYRR